MLENEGASADSRKADWEEELPPERAALKETADLLASVMQTVSLVDKPQRTIAGYAEEFLRKHEAELPPSVIEEINNKRLALLNPAKPQD